MKSLGASEVFDYKEPELGPKIRAFTQDRLKVAWDPISTPESAQICAEALSSNSTGCRYASFLGNKSPRADVESVGTNLYTVWGESFKTGQLEYPASREDFDWAKRFMVLAETLLAQGSVKPHREMVRTGGLEGVAAGLDDLKNGLVSGGKLVYRIADTP